VNDVKLLNRILWGVNVLLGAGIVVFSFQYLLFAPDAKYLKDFKQEDDSPSVVKGPTDTGDGALRTLPNPVEKRIVQGPSAASDFKAMLKGTLPSEKEPQRGVAFIKSMGRNVELVAYVGDEILHEGKPFDEFRGWTLTSVTRDRAFFACRDGRKAELFLDLNPTPTPGGVGGPGVNLQPGGRPAARQGAPYQSDQYKSRLLASADSRQVWGMDQDEIEWVSQNAEQIMDRDFQVAPYAGGGLRIENVNAGTVGAARGLVAGDVLREVNGQPLNNIADVRTLMNNPAMKQQTGLRLTIERAGKPVVIEYRPLPK